eukprot:3441412-Pleurochrysis_carterae.AAC.1
MAVSISAVNSTYISHRQDQVRGMNHRRRWTLSLLRRRDVWRVALGAVESRVPSGSRLRTRAEARLWRLLVRRARGGDAATGMGVGGRIRGSVWSCSWLWACAGARACARRGRMRRSV